MGSGPPVSWVMFFAWLGLGAWGATKLNDEPLGVWAQLGTDTYATVVNETPDSVPVGAIGLKVDRIIRLLGFVQGRDSATFRIPYADTDVLLLVDSWWVPIDTRLPGTHRVTVRSISRPAGPRGDNEM